MSRHARVVRAVFLPALAAALAAPALAQLQLEEVIVTAQKREQTLQDVPGSVVALSDDVLRETVTNNFSDLTKITSGLTITGAQDGFGKVIRLRGVGTNSFVPAIRPAVGIFLNEIPLGAPEMAYNNLADIERIEVLKGPQATLFGKEVSSGAISLFVREPNTEAVDAYFETNVGNLGLREFRGGANTPLGDEAALRFSAYYNDRNHTIANAAVPERPGGAYDQWGFRAHFRWNINEDVTATLGYEDHATTVYGSTSIPQQYGDLYQTLDQRDPGPTRLQIRDPWDRVTANSDPSDRKTDISMWSLHVNWDINDEWSLTSITSDQQYELATHGDQNAFGTSDTSVGPYYLNDFTNEPSTDTFTQEVRVNFDRENWSSIIGAFYAETDTVSYTPFSTLVGIVAGGALEIKAAGLSDLIDDFDEWAIYTHNIYSFNERLDLTFGLRYSEVEKEAIKGQITGIGPLAALNSSFVPVNTWGDRIPVQNDTWDEVTGTLKLTYWLNEDVSVYGGWDRGFKTGGHNTCKNQMDEPVCPEPFDAETADNFEVGLKGRFLDNTLSMNLAVFYQTFDNYQVEIADEVGIGNSIQNAAEAEIYGVETELLWLVDENLTLAANVSYIEASWESYEDAGCLRAQYQRQACRAAVDENGNDVFIQDISGGALNYAPDWTANGSATWADTFDNGWDWYLRGEAVYRDDQYFFPDLDPDLVGDGYILLNATLGLTSPDGDWTITLWGKNLDNEEYLSSGARNRDNTQPTVNPTSNVEGFRVTVGEERTYGVTFRYAL